MSSNRAKKNTRPTNIVSRTEEAVCRRLRTCCPESGCTGFQKALSFLHSFGIEPEMGLDDDGHYFEFALPKGWSLSDRRRFNGAIARRLSSHTEPCGNCGNVMYSEAVIAACNHCGREFLMCEECPLEDADPCDCQSR